MKLSGPNCSPIGIDIGSRSIKAIQVRIESGEPVISSAAFVPRAGDHTLFGPNDAERLMSVLFRQGFTGERVIVAVPSHQLLSAVMELPPRSSGAPLGEIARAELARSQKTDPSQIEMVWWDLPGGARANEGTHVMALGMRHADSDALIAAFESAGADMVAIDAPSLATVRALSSRLIPAPGLTAIADISWSGSELVIVQGDVIVYERTINELGLSVVVEQLKKRLNVDDDSAGMLLRQLGCAPPGELNNQLAESQTAAAIVSQHADALAGELTMSLSYAARRFGTSVGRVLLTGGAGSVPGLAAHLGSSIDTPVVAATAADLLRVDAPCVDTCRIYPMLTALGLAMHQIEAPMKQGAIAA